MQIPLAGIQLHLVDGLTDISIPKASLARHMLDALVFTKRPPFQIWPCDAIAFPRSEYIYAIQFGVAVQLNHQHLANILQYRSSHRRPENISYHWQQISVRALRFWREQKPQHETADILRQLHVNYGDASPTEDNWELWTYSRIINAVVEDGYASFQALLLAWDVKIALEEPSWSFAFFGHLLLQAVLHSREVPAEDICAQVRTLLVAYHFGFESEIFPRTQYDGLDCSVVEIAQLRPNSNSTINVIVALAQVIRMKPSSDFHESLFATDKLQDAIMDHHSSRLTQLIRAMGVTEQSLSAAGIMSIFYPVNEGTRRTEDIDAIRYCVHHWKKAIRTKPPDLLKDCVIGYHSHWISNFDGLMSPLCTIDMILISGGKPSLQDGIYLLHYAIRCEHENNNTQLQLKRIERLIAADVPISGPGSDLFVSVQLFQERLQRFAPGIRYLSLVYYSILHNQVRVAKILIDAGALAMEPSAHGLSPFHFAVVGQAPATFQLLLFMQVSFIVTNQKYLDFLNFVHDALDENPVVRQEILGLVENNLELFTPGLIHVMNAADNNGGLRSDQLRSASEFYWEDSENSDS